MFWVGVAAGFVLGVLVLTVVLGMLSAGKIEDEERLKYVRSPGNVRVLRPNQDRALSNLDQAIRERGIDEEDGA